MTLIIRRIALFILLIAAFAEARAQGDWVLVNEKDGIKVFNNPKSGEKIKPIKVECTLNATPSQLVAVLLDINNYPDWVYKTKAASLVKQVSPGELYYYGQVIVPWPAQSRDFVAHLTITQAPDKTITVDAPSVKGMVPVKDDMMRIYGSKGKWIITSVGKQVKVVYYLQIDPGEGAPTFLVNMFATDGPMQTFRKLKVQLQKNEYKNAQLSFIDN